MATNLKNEYMPAIDGLRAVAVLGVVLFHFFPKYVPGGFVGVDVFFVISGYLVTRIILNSLDENVYSVTNFYMKRVARLFPALLLVLFTVVLCSVFSLLGSELEIFGRHLFSGVFFFSNVQYFLEAGYFDKSSESKVLLHLWSLSLEEQFYFIWPFLLSLAIRFKDRLKGHFIFIFIFTLCLISFTLNIYASFTHQSLAFFMLPFRLWELGCGGGLAVLQRSIFIDEKKYLHIYTPISWAGFLLILYSFFSFSKLTVFPGFAALVPVVGTLCLLASRTDEVGIKEKLRIPFIVYIGKVSYPFYLWHWPIFSLSYIIYGGYLSSFYRILLMILSFVLAVLTYELVEKKVKAKSTKRMAALVSMSLLLGVSGYFLSSVRGWRPLEYQKYDAIAESKASFVESNKEHRKSIFCNDKFHDLELCLLQDETRPPTIVLIGDSHANHWYPGISEIIGRRENLLLLAKSGTLPFLDIKSKRNPDTDLDKELEFVLASKTIHTVILSAFWSNYFEEKGTYVSGYYYKNSIYSRSVASDNQGSVFIHNFERTLVSLTKKNKKVIFFYDTPALDFELDACGIRPFRNYGRACSYSSLTENEKQDGYRKAVRPYLAEYRVITFDPLAVLCDSNSCRIVEKDRFLFSDSHHLSIWGSKNVIEALKTHGQL